MKSLAIDSVGMGFRGSSTARGRRPDWMKRASDIRFVGLSSDTDDSTLLHFTAPRFGDVAAEVYREGQLFGALPVEADSAFDLLGDIITDVAQRRRDSDRFDIGVLQRLEGFKEPVFHHGVDEISLLGGRRCAGAPPRIDAALSDIAASLYQETPAPLRARIAGRLDMIRASDKVFTLILQDAQKVRGIWLGTTLAPLRDHLDQDVVINGMVTYRPSGSVLRLDAQTIDAAGPADQLFSRLPSPSGGVLRAPRLLQPQTGSAEMKAVFGKWPGDETDDEILRTLAEVE
ncbi:MAG TPA: hypothetical protein VFC78_08615 [Tepidisphaeraceae bacterium]|nr:hypothetical protein [Tepidisphaeraceae bacterium]